MQRRRAMRGPGLRSTSGAQQVQLVRGEIAGQRHQLSACRSALERSGRDRPAATVRYESQRQVDGPRVLVAAHGQHDLRGARELEADARDRLRRWQKVQEPALAVRAQARQHLRRPGVWVRKVTCGDRACDRDLGLRREREPRAMPVTRHRHYCRRLDRRRRYRGWLRARSSTRRRPRYRLGWCAARNRDCDQREAHRPRHRASPTPR